MKIGYEGVSVRGVGSAGAVLKVRKFLKIPGGSRTATAQPRLEMSLPTRRAYMPPFGYLPF